MKKLLSLLLTMNLGLSLNASDLTDHASASNPTAREAARGVGQNRYLVKDILRAIPGEDFLKPGFVRNLLCILGGSVSKAEIEELIVSHSAKIGPQWSDPRISLVVKTSLGTKMINHPIYDDHGNEIMSIPSSQLRTPYDVALRFFDPIMAKHLHDLVCTFASNLTENQNTQLASQIWMPNEEILNFLVLARLGITGYQSNIPYHYFERVIIDPNSCHSTVRFLINNTTRSTSNNNYVDHFNDLTRVNNIFVHFGLARKLDSIRIDKGDLLRLCDKLIRGQSDPINLRANLEQIVNRIDTSDALCHRLQTSGSFFQYFYKLLNVCSEAEIEDLYRQSANFSDSINLSLTYSQSHKRYVLMDTLRRVPAALRQDFVRLSNGFQERHPESVILRTWVGMGVLEKYPYLNLTPLTL